MGTVVNGTPWLIFLYYSSVFAYALRSLAQNEFYSPPYSIFPSQAARTNSTAWDAVPMGVPITELGSPLVTYYYTQATCDSNTALLTCGPESYGTQSLMALNINLQPEWKWGGVGFLLFFLILSNVISGWALAAVQIERNIGTSRTKDEDEPGGAEEGDAKALPSPAEERAVVEVSPAGSVASVLPFTPMTVTWRDVKYTVQLNANLGGGSKTLLQGVSGIAVPGRLISLMGASGAGKSTLLDVIAGRKTAGKMEGKILLNGFQTEAKSFARLTAYCEQQDIHNSFATVREALSFSAALRLSRDVSATTREAFVEEVMDLLELRSIANRMIGEVGAANGLAPGQRKILTIGVELVSNAPILFLVRASAWCRACRVFIRASCALSMPCL
jgi:ABC-type branched-subunit amino acid transport system ATPase component